jgi:hypothetical protein
MANFIDLEKMSDTDAKAELAELTGNPKSAYLDTGHWDHVPHVERVTKLYERLYPEDPALAGADEGIKGLAPHLEGLEQKDIDDAQDQLEGLDADRDTARVEKDLKIELGEKGYAETVELARTVVDTFATPEQREDLAESGKGNDPTLIKALAEVGRALKK